jgi:hypothetical protein
MNCQNGSCTGRPVTTTLNFGGQPYNVCDICEQKITAAVGRLNNTLANLFGTSPENTAETAQLLTGQLAAGSSANDAAGNLLQAAGADATAIHGPAPSADHPHPADQGCDHLCRPAASAAASEPQRTIEGTIVAPPAAALPAAKPLLTRNYLAGLGAMAAVDLGLRWINKATRQHTAAVRVGVDHANELFAERDEL